MNGFELITLAFPDFNSVRAFPGVVGIKGSKKFLIGLFGPVITILLILLDIRMSANF